MSLLLRYYRSLHLLVLLGVIAYSVAEENLMYAMIAAPIVLAAYLIVGGPKGRPLPRWGINLSLLFATGVMVLDWGGVVGGEVISVLCAYLVWLQLIKLFEARAPRDQAQVILLSLMLVVGACLTSVTVELGAVLLVYLPVLLVTAMLYQVYAAHASTAAAPAKESRTPLPGSGSGWSRLAAWLLGNAADNEHPALPAFAAAGRGGRSDLTRTALVASLVIAAVAPAVYVILPRGVGDNVFGQQWRPAEPTPITGFRDHVQLGAQGLLTESQRTVMHMRAESVEDPSMGLGRTLRLRGAVLDVYDPALRTWRRSTYVSQSDRRASLGPREFLKPMNPRGPLLSLHISLVDQPVNYLFTVWRPLWIIWPIDPRRTTYEFNDYDWQARVPIRGDTFEYTVVCAPSEGSSESPAFRRFTRVEIPLAPETLIVNSQGETPESAPPPQFQQGRVRALAERLLGDNRIVLDPSDRDARRRAAGAFVRHLQQNYRYTTQLTAPAPGEDPIESFLFDSERGGRGHCEYFASALAAMCLSVGVPARIVTGYIASEYNVVSDQYTVRENHAHAWVEVEATPGHWEDFDPSPSEDVRRLHSPQGLFAAAFRRISDAVQLAWVEGIVTFNRERQSDTIRALSIAPMDAFRALNRRISDMLATEEQIAHENRTVYLTRMAGWGVLIATGLLLAVHLSVTRGLPWLAGVFGARGRPAKSAPRDPMLGELEAAYQRLWLLLRQAGLVRHPSTPALAFLRGVPADHRAMVDPARRLAERYYLARFAGERVVGEHLVEVRGLLRLVEQAARAR